MARNQRGFYSGVQLPAAVQQSQQYTSTGDEVIPLAGTVKWVAFATALMGFSVTAVSGEDRAWIDVLTIAAQSVTSNNAQTYTITPQLTIGSVTGAVVWQGATQNGTAAPTTPWSMTWPTGLLLTPGSPLILSFKQGNAVVGYTDQMVFSGSAQIRRQREVPTYMGSTNTR